MSRCTTPCACACTRASVTSRAMRSASATGSAPSAPTRSRSDDPVANGPSVGSRGDSYNNALAETIIGLFKTEVIHRDGLWRGPDDVEMATLEWVSWFNTIRLLEPLGCLPPAEYEAQYQQQVTAADSAAVALK